MAPQLSHQWIGCMFGINREQMAALVITPYPSSNVVTP